MPERVRITEVGPRDGLQNEPGVIPTADKVRLIELCCQTGVDEVEVTSFVSPKWVPQLGDAAEVLGAIAARGERGQGTVISALVPNDRGMQSLHELAAKLGRAPLDKVSVFTAASETFNRKNTNASIGESIERFKPVIASAKGAGLRVRGYVSCVIACPFEGAIAPEKVLGVARQLIAIGVDEIDLGDTIGAGTPKNFGAMLDAVRDAVGPSWWNAERMTLHLHDTFGRAAECVVAALNLGVRSFDGSVAGLGGCPYASTPGKRAPGNIATETLVKTIHDAGLETGVDLARVDEAAQFARRIVSEARARVP